MTTAVFSSLLFCILFSPSLSSSVRLLFCSPSLPHFSLTYSLNILAWFSLLNSIAASLCIDRGLGNVTLEHSFKSVTLLLLSSYIFVLGSKIWRVLASSSSASNSASSVLIFSASFFSPPFMFCSFSFALFSISFRSSISSSSSIFSSLFLNSILAFV